VDISSLLSLQCAHIWLTPMRWRTRLHHAPALLDAHHITITTGVWSAARRRQHARAASTPAPPSPPQPLAALRVPGLPIRDCARGCNNCVHTRSQMCAIDMTEKILFERLYLVPGMSTFGPSVKCPCAPTTLTVHTTTISRFLCNVFPRMAPHFFGHHDSPSNLAESQ